MSRKNFLSADFFVTATESEAREALSLIPHHLPHITFLKENTIVQSTRFLYDHLERTAQYYVDVSILPLDNQCVRFSLHCSYTSGQSFQSDVDLSNALNCFEQSVYAALKNDFSSFQVEKKEKSYAKKGSYLGNFFLSMIFSKYHY